MQANRLMTDKPVRTYYFFQDLVTRYHMDDVCCIKASVSPYDTMMSNWRDGRRMPLHRKPRSPAILGSRQETAEALPMCYLPAASCCWLYGVRCAPVEQLMPAKKRNWTSLDHETNLVRFFRDKLQARRVLWKEIKSGLIKMRHMAQDLRNESRCIAALTASMAACQSELRCAIRLVSSVNCKHNAGTAQRHT